MVAVQAVSDKQLLLSPLTKWICLLIILIPARTLANPVVPTFRTGSQTTNSTSQSIINETISSYQYRTGYTYSASGNNIKSNDANGYINPTPSQDATQTINNVNFSFTSPTLESVPRWQIVTEGSPFSLQETIIAPGLDTITNISRTINTTTTVTVESTFGQ